MKNRTLSLIMRRGPTPGAIYHLKADEITIGRGSKNAIIIHDNEVSRDHCRLIKVIDEYEIQDVGSKTGIFVNGQRVVAPRLLQHGSLIEFGDTVTLEYGTLEADDVLAADQLPLATDAHSHFSLIMTDGPIVGSIYPLTGSIITIGRDLTSDIVVEDTEVSRFHTRLHFTEHGYMVEDLGSTNGTFVNDEPLHTMSFLQPNDVLRLGTLVQFEYVFREQAFASLEQDTTFMRQSPPPAVYHEPTLTNMYNVRTTTTARSIGLEPGLLRDHLLIVYARENWEGIVAPLMVRLQDTRLNAWVDQYLTLGSDQWQVAVEQAVTECWLMVLVVTEAALNSSHVKMMYRYFLNEGKPVVPLVYAQVPLPPELSRLRSIAYDPENPQRTFHKLIFEIMQRHQ